MPNLGLYTVKPASAAMCSLLVSHVWHWKWSSLAWHFGHLSFLSSLSNTYHLPSKTDTDGCNESRSRI